MAMSRRVVLALLAVCDIALHARENRVSARNLSQRYKLPPRHFETILQDLTRAGLIRGQRGPKGGYELAKERRKLPVWAIVDAVRGQADTDRFPANGSAARLVGPVIAAANLHLKTLLDEMTIEDVLARASIVLDDQSSNFTI